MIRLTPVREVIFWFNYNSPYSMLSHQRIERQLAEYDVQVRYRPWFTGVRLPDYDSPRVQYVVHDVLRFARAYGLTLRPGKYVDLGAACRGFLLARECGLGRTYNQRVHDARWFEGRDISRPELLQTIARDCGLPADEFDQALAGGRWAEAMEQELADGRAAGVFGVPFFEFEGETFWGNDRLDWLVDSL